MINNKLYVDNGVGLTDYEKVGWPEGATPAIAQGVMGRYDIDYVNATTPGDFHGCISGTNEFLYRYTLGQSPVANKTQSMAST